MRWLGSWRFTVPPPTITRPVRDALPYGPREAPEWPIYSENRAPEAEIKLPDQTNGRPSAPGAGFGGSNAMFHVLLTFFFILTFAHLHRKITSRFTSWFTRFSPVTSWLNFTSLKLVNHAGNQQVTE